MNTTPIALSLLFVLTACAGSPAAPSVPRAEPASSTTTSPVAEAPEGHPIVAVIDRFLADPTPTDARAILDFTRDSPDVLVVFRQPLTGHPGADDDARPLLLAAFAAGNAKAQLEQGEKGDRPVDGVRALLTVAPKLGVRGDALERWAAADAEGRLDEVIASLLAE